MKKLHTYFTLAIVVFAIVASCSKSETAPSQSLLLIGTWKKDSFIRTNCTDPLQNEALFLCVTVSGECETLVFNFLVGGLTTTTLTFKVTGIADVTVPITITGSTIVTTPPSGDTVTFVVAGATLTLTSQSPATGGSPNCKNVNVYTKVP